MTDEEKLLQIIQAISRSRAPIRATTYIFSDLSIAGDDAVELLERIRDTFGTSFEGFDFGAYFPNETEAFVFHLQRLIGFPAKKKKLSVGHLLSVIRVGHWFEET